MVPHFSGSDGSPIISTTHFCERAVVHCELIIGPGQQSLQSRGSQVDHGHYDDAQRPPQQSWLGEGGMKREGADSLYVSACK
jgi:hypothetical protein